MKRQRAGAFSSEKISPACSDYTQDYQGGIIMAKRVIQTHWNGKIKKLAGIIDTNDISADAGEADSTIEEEQESSEEIAEQPTDPTNTTVFAEIRVPSNGQDGRVEASDAEPVMSETHTPECTSEPTEAHNFTVSIPRSSLSDTALDNLQKMVDAKETLFKKSIGTDSLEIGITDDQIDFPWFTAKEPAVEQAYTHFITLLCDRARKAKRVTAKERDVENERYAMRGFLLQIGAIGKEYSVMRKVLMDGLSGSAAFRDQKRKSELA